MEGGMEGGSCALPPDPPTMRALSCAAVRNSGSGSGAATSRPSTRASWYSASLARPSQLLAPPLASPPPPASFRSSSKSADHWGRRPCGMHHRGERGLSSNGAGVHAWTHPPACMDPSAWMHAWIHRAPACMDPPAWMHAWIQPRACLHGPIRLRACMDPTARLHAWIQPRACMHGSACMPTWIHSQTRARKYRDMHAHTACIHACMDACMERTLFHACTSTSMHAHAPAIPCMHMRPPHHACTCARHSMHAHAPATPYMHMRRTARRVCTPQGPPLAKPAGPTPRARRSQRSGRRRHRRRRPHQCPCLWLHQRPRRRRRRRRHARRHAPRAHAPGIRRRR
eukprot:366294-Chlamydomonas_euryale.AAC.1